MRLTYANVVSTLALFLVLAGGTALATTRIGKGSVGTAQIKSSAVTTAKIRNRAVTGAKIKLSTLGTVPSAATAIAAETARSASTADFARASASAGTAAHADSADTATSAAHADSADAATSAGHADSADAAGSADTAADAATLGGSPPQSFMRSDRFAFGTASTDPGTPQTVLSIGGIEVTTPGSAPTEFRVRIVNRNSDQWEFTTTAEPGISTVGEGQATLLGPPTAGVGGPLSGGSMLISGRDRTEPEKAIAIQCGSDIAPDLLDCFAQLSPAA